MVSHSAYSTGFDGSLTILLSNGRLSFATRLPFVVVDLERFSTGWKWVGGMPILLIVDGRDAKR